MHLLNKVRKEEAPGNKDETKGGTKGKKGKRIIIEEVDDTTGSDEKQESPVEEVKSTIDHIPLTHPPVDHTPLLILHSVFMYSFKLETKLHFSCNEVAIVTIALRYKLLKSNIIFGIGKYSHIYCVNFPELLL